MKKAIIASAVAAAIAAPFAASADVTIYGKSRVTLSKNDSSTAGTDNWLVGDATPRIGFKGSEDLGGGLKAVFKLESEFDVDNRGTGSNALSNTRDSYVGLSGSWGTFLGGRLSTPYKLSFYGSGIDMSDGLGQLDLHTMSIGGTAANYQDELRTNNALAYVSPNMSGATIMAAVVPGENTDADGRNGIADNYSLGLTYKGGSFKLGAGYESLAGTAGAPDEDRMHISGTVSFGNASVGLSWNQVDNDGNVQNQDRDTLALTGQMKVGGNNRIVGVYQKMDADNAAWAAGTRGEFTKLGVAFEHKMSKRTKVFVSYAKDDWDAATAGTADLDETDITFGLYHDF